MLRLLEKLFTRTRKPSPSIRRAHLVLESFEPRNLPSVSHALPTAPAFFQRLRADQPAAHREMLHQAVDLQYRRPCHCRCRRRAHAAAPVSSTGALQQATLWSAATSRKAGGS